ncbi:hypothetical protein ADK66_26690 [Micromonospora sp. NRRL B-16802]|nr:hypothetical protein ADK66_26690 [Micromonospora sp. NRRL B-16802]
MAGQCLDQLGHRRAGEAQVPVSALPLFDKQSTPDESGEVVACRRRGDAGPAGQLAGGPGAAVEQRDADVGAGAVGKQRGQLGHRPSLDATTHAPIIAATRVAPVGRLPGRARALFTTLYPSL